MIRWPQYAAGPQAQEQVTDEGTKASSFAKKLRKAGIDNSMVESLKGDMTPGSQPPGNGPNGPGRSSV